LAPSRPQAPAAAAPRWNPATRLLFRFTFAYFALYIFPFPLNGIFFFNDITTNLWDGLVRTVARYVFGVEITVRPNGSGDTTWNYVQVFCILALAVAVTAVWSLLGRRRTAYPRLFQALRLWVRYYLAALMITYGVVKVIPSQFPRPPLDRLLQPFGDASPMGLLWTFMGASVGYNFFTGAGEMLGGLLLTTRRTTLLGSLVCVGVLSNVVMLNFCYDVPVKLFSVHLVAMALFLIAPDLRRLADLFVFGHASGPLEYRPLVPGWKWTNRVVVVLRTLAVAVLVGGGLYEAHQARNTYGDLAPRSPLYGVWEVERFETDGNDRPPLMTDKTRWRRVVFDYPKMIAVQLMSDNRRRFSLKLNEEGGTLALTRFDDKDWKADLSYSRPEEGVLTLEGTFEGAKIRARLRRADDAGFLLRSRGFHWVNEYPFNR
jgi:hypothetical protein